MSTQEITISINALIVRLVASSDLFHTVHLDWPPLGAPR